MSMLIEGVDMPLGTNMMLLISPEGEVWEMGDLLGNDKHIDGAKARQSNTGEARRINEEGELTEQAKSLIHLCPQIINELAKKIGHALDNYIVNGEGKT